MAGFVETSLRLCLPTLARPPPSEPGNKPDTSALTAYLTETFEKLTRLPDTELQLSMLGAWITELLLASRSGLTSPLARKTNDAGIATFLARSARSLDAATTLSVMSGHACLPHEVAAIAAALGSYEGAVKAALEVRSQGSTSEEDEATARHR